MQPYQDFLTKLGTLEYETVKSNKQITYLNIEAGFDIETTSTTHEGNKVSFMYVWMFGMGYGQPTYYGNSWSDFLTLCQNLQHHFNLSDKRRLVIYVHNLGYEFQFMREYFEWTDVFSNSERKPMKAMTSLGIEFRCSYILSGYSLANTAKNLTETTIKKMEGDLDYSLTRHHNTPLTPSEIKYCEEDIQIVLAYIKEQITQCGDISKIPMTNTGRVRKYVRDYCYYKKSDGSKGGRGQYTRYRNLMRDLTLNVPTYLQLKRAFMGGFTHANANLTGITLNGVTSIDFTSSYPAVMVSEKFPMTRFKPTNIVNLEDFRALCRNNAVIFDAKFTNIHPRITQENYLSESKCQSTENAVINNGRISSADSITTTLTEVDLDIMEQCYQWESLEVANVKYAIKGYLPKPIVESVLRLYQGKTELKDVEGSEVEYQHSKGMLNSIYGMCVMDVVKPQAEYTEGEWTTTLPDLEEAIEKYNDSRNRFLYYPWGIWITAYARRNLWTGIIATGDDYVYSDTDSLKILNYKKHEKYITWYDAQILKKMEDMCDEYDIPKTLLSPKTKEGLEKVLGVWDYEGTYRRFKTLGAKRYLVQDSNNIAITVAGLSKQNGIAYMADVSNNDPEKIFDMFSDDLYIPPDKTGKMTHTYVDCQIELTVIDYLGNKAQVNTLSGIHLEPCEFTLSMSSQYMKFIEMLSKGYIYRGISYE